MIKKISILLIIFICCIIPHAIFAENANDAHINASLFSGTSFLHIEGKSFDTKMVPVAGISLSSYFFPRNIFFYGVELAYMYSFKSNYNNYYYYDSYSSLSLLPHLGIHFQTPSLTYFFLLGCGGSISFSRYLSKNYFIASAGVGIYFKKFFIDGLLLSYNHSFFKNFTVFETLKVHAIIHLWRKNQSSSK